MIILNSCPSLSSDAIHISRGSGGSRRINLPVPRLYLFNILMGFLMRKGCVGRSIMDSSERLCHIYVSASRGRDDFFLILLTCFNFPGPSARSLPPSPAQQHCESFPFDFSLICTHTHTKHFPYTSRRVSM